MSFVKEDNDGRLPWQIQAIAAFRQDNRDFISETVNSGQGNLTDTWVSGGRIQSGDATSGVDRINFANDTNIATVRGAIHVCRDVSSVGNTTDGWVFGGENVQAGVNVQTISRIIFATDTNSASFRGNLEFELSLYASRGNSSSGWIYGGNTKANIYSGIWRIDFQNDNFTAFRRNNVIINGHSATGNSTDLWFNGGTQYPGPVRLSQIQRLTFSNDVESVQLRGPMQVARRFHTSSGNQTDGWIFSGQNTQDAPIQTIERIIFANDVVSPTLRSTMGQANLGIAQNGNTTDAWVSGGLDIVGGIRLSTVERLTFANDTNIAQFRGNLTVGKSGQAQV